MARIERIAIRGFQSHFDSLFNLAPGLTIITGPSDAGKTAVIRALRWLAFNEPTGDAFLHTVRDQQGDVVSQAEYTEVIVSLDDGTVITKTRRKGKTSYRLSDYPDQWEKAEVPPEIKAALGLEKQVYGDNYETCLNFAFQLDPPFILSETGSVGAKVLGKLAGTEVVDRAIGAVTKSTHRTREARTQAEKRIGQLDVELLEYLEVDDKLQLLEGAEARYDAVVMIINIVESLNNLTTMYTRHTTARETAQERLQWLENVEALQECLHTAEINKERRDTLVQLATWYSAHHSKIAHQQARLSICMQVVSKAEALAQVEQLQKKAEQLAFLVARRTTILSDIDREIKLLRIYNAAVAKADFLAKVEHSQVKRENFVLLANMHNKAVHAVENWTAATAKLDAINGMDEKLGAFDDTLQRISDLQTVARNYSTSTLQLDNCVSDQKISAKQYADAEAEVAAAWSAAGGVCPLCGQTLEGGADTCQ